MYRRHPLPFWARRLYQLMTGDLVSNVMPLGEPYKIDAILKNKPVFSFFMLQFHNCAFVSV